MDESRRILLALSFSPQRISAPARAALRAAAGTALARLCAGQPPVVAAEDETCSLLVSPAVRELARDRDTGSVAVLASPSGHTTGGAPALAPAALLTGHDRQGTGIFRRVVPPFAAFLRTAADAPVIAATDACGVHHLYLREGDGWCACASSCLALAGLGAAALDWEALGTYARIGFYLEEQTPFRDVRRLLRGTAAVLDRGSLRIESWASDRGSEPPFASFEESVAAGAETVRSAVASCLDAHPVARISLSGGLDSRLVLAAVPPDRRTELEALTLAAPGDPEWRAAESVARAARIRWAPLDLREFDALSHPALRELARRGSLLRDHSANPLAAAMLEWAESRLPQTPRLSGQNGEFARGFYYAGQSLEGPPSRRRIERFTRWRLLTGDSASPAVFTRDFNARLREALDARLADLLLPGERSWPDALDEFYLRGRVEGWGGVEVTRSASRRVDLCPFFDPRFLGWSRRAPPAHKRGGRLLAGVLASLDPALARLPLDGRPSPEALWKGGLAVRLGALQSSGAKALRKLQQRLGGKAAAPVGAPRVHRAALAPEDDAAPLLARVREAGPVDSSFVDAIAAGERDTDVATLGFLLALEWLLEFAEPVASDAPAHRDAALTG